MRLSSCSTSCVFQYQYVLARASAQHLAGRVYGWGSKWGSASQMLHTCAVKHCSSSLKAAGGRVQKPPLAVIAYITVVQSGQGNAFDNVLFWLLGARGEGCL